MADIKVLPKDLAELIAAGEVVERPASVIKELIENSIDAGADKITVEIQRGGISYMRVADNGCGIARAQVPTAFLRHATSKIKDENDLFRIATMGFRGEALASISAVARVELFTKSCDEDLGTHYVIEGGVEQENSEASCPEGTTIVIRDLFYNTPARMKFLKKDTSEATAVAAVVDAIALAHPEVNVRFIKDSKSCLATSGDGKLTSAVYSVLGREFASGLIPVDSSTGGIRVTGLTCKPIYCRPTRSGQYFFINNRFIRSGVIAKALDQAYKSAIMVGKFPACVLKLEIPFDRVDVNVHPAKTEVRFSDEKAVFDAVYYAVKNALAQGDTRPQLSLDGKQTKKEVEPFARMTVEEFKNTQKPPQKTLAESIYGVGRFSQPSPVKPSAPAVSRPAPASFEQKESAPVKAADFETPIIANETIPLVLPKSEPLTEITEKKPSTVPATEQKPAETSFYQKVIDIFTENDEQRYENARFMEEAEVEFRYIGEIFRTYILIQFKGSLWFIDKHAAHERQLYEKLKKEGVTEVQTLLSPVAVTLSREEHRVVCDSLELLKTSGFEVEEFGTSSVLVRAVPASLVKTDVMFLMCDIAANLLKYGKAETKFTDSLYHSIACRSAIKGGNTQSDAELEAFAKEIISNNDIMYCPHGRPVAFELTRRELEKQFGRTK